jgi:hypothetical protein
MERHRRTTVRFQAGHIPSCRVPCERYALSPVAAVSRWLLLLLSLLLSAAIERPAGVTVCVGSVKSPFRPRARPPQVGIVVSRRMHCVRAAPSGPAVTGVHRLSPIGLTAADLSAGGQVSWADSLSARERNWSPGGKLWVARGPVDGSAPRI